MCDSEEVTDNTLENDDNSEPLYDRYGFYGGQQFTKPEDESRISLEVLRLRELKWRKMCANWDEWYLKNFIKLRHRCRKGIPDSFRGEAWQRLCTSPMVLVQRQKIYKLDNSEVDTPRSKFLFGTILRNTNSKSLQLVTSPSIRVTKVKEDNRRKNLLLQKLNGGPLPVSCNNSSFLSLRTKCKMDSDFGYPTVSIPFDKLSLNSTTASSPNTRHQSSPTANHGSFGHLTTTITTTTSSYEVQLPYSVYSTLESKHENSCPPAEVPPARSSGGYASLSTASEGTPTTTNSSSIEANHYPNEISSTESCASFFFVSSSVASSSSSAAALANPMEFVNGGDGGDNDDARATLVPSLDPDPDKMYSFYCLQEGTQANCNQIRKDIDRQFPFHVIFSTKGGHGQESLYKVLKAYTIRHPNKGYCQGQAPLAAILLMFMPELDAFWTFCEICERYLSSYYDEGLERIQIDGEVVYSILANVYPSIHKFLIPFENPRCILASTHRSGSQLYRCAFGSYCINLDTWVHLVQVAPCGGTLKHNVNPNIVLLEWFMCAFTRTLPWPAVLRVWDMFLCEGKIILFKVAIVLLHRMFGAHAFRKSCTDMDDILMRLREVSNHVNDVDAFVREVVRVRLSPRELSQHIIRQSHKWSQKESQVKKNKK